MTEIEWSAGFVGDEEFAQFSERAFGASPLGDVSGGRAAAQVYEFFRARPAASAITARATDGSLAAYAYGYPHFTWADHTSEWDQLLREALGGEDEHLVGAFTLMFVAVDPELQGQGLGRELLRRVIPAGTTAAWLATRDAATPAQGLYASEGWREIGRGPLAGPGQRSAVLWKSFD